MPPAALPPRPPVSGFWSHCGFSLCVFCVHSAALLTCLLVSFPVSHLLTFCFERVYLSARPAFLLSWCQLEQLRVIRTLPREAVLRGSRGSHGVWSLVGAVASLSSLLPCCSFRVPRRLSPMAGGLAVAPVCMECWKGPRDSVRGWATLNIRIFH